MILFRMLQHGLHGFGIARGGFALYGYTSSLIADEEIKFQPTIFMIILQFASHLAEDVGNQIFVDGAIIAEKISLQYA